MSGVLHLRSSRGFYGAERVILDLARGCARHGVHSAIACIVDEREPHRELAQASRQAGLAAWELDSRHRFDLRTLGALVALLRKEKPAILHLHGYKAQILGWLASRVVGGMPLVVTHHGDTALSPAVRAYETFARLLLARCDRVIAVSAEGEKLLGQQLRHTPVLHIPNGVDVEAIAARVQAAPDLRPRLGLADRAVVLSVGRLSPEKGHALLLAAVARLPEPRPFVVLAGEGPLCDHLSDMARRQGVELLLAGYQQDLSPWWRMADLLCQPSRREGLPLAVLEGMAAGLPVVASAVGELPEVLGTGTDVDDPAEAGLIVAPGDDVALSQALLRLLGPGAAAAREEMAARARRRVARQYSLAAVVARTIGEVYLPLAPGLVRGDDQPTASPCEAAPRD